VSGFVRRNLATALSLPDELHQVLQKAKKGTLEVHNLDVRNGARLLYYGVQQLIFALLLIATMVIGYLFWKESAGKYVSFAGYACLFWVWMLHRTMRKGAKYL
jgi:positive regulator of sigma E activity